MSRAEIEPYFLAREGHTLFGVLFSPPAGLAQAGAMIHVPAFADEMNKSRRAVANTARAMAHRGWQVLVLDLHGTGDSSDDFGDASWSGWLDDLRFAVAWLREKTGREPVLWGLRAGCLLINDVLEQVSSRELIFWQPTARGDAALTQFLRLRTVGAVGTTGRPKETTKALVETLQGGTPLEVGGYLLAPSVALPLSRSRLGGARYAGVRIAWLEVSTADPPELLPPSKLLIDELGAAGAQVVAHAVPGIQFWSTQEIDEGAALAASTLEQLGLVVA